MLNNDQKAALTSYFDVVSQSTYKDDKTIRFFDTEAELVGVVRPWTKMMVILGGDYLLDKFHVGAKEGHIRKTDKGLFVTFFDGEGYTLHHENIGDSYE